MFAGKKVKIRFKRYFVEQRVRVFVGTVLEMDNYWIKAKGKNYYLVKGDARPRIDEADKVLVIPRDNVYVVRELPDEIDLDGLSFDIVDMRMVINVPGEAAAAISE